MHGDWILISLANALHLSYLRREHGTVIHHAPRLTNLLTNRWLGVFSPNSNASTVTSRRMVGAAIRCLRSLQTSRTSLSNHSCQRFCCFSSIRFLTFSTIWSTEKLAGGWLGGYSTKVSRKAALFITPYAAR